MTAVERAQVVYLFDKLVTAQNPNPNEAPGLVHPCQARLSEVTDRDIDYAQMVKKIERHTDCRESACLRNITRGQKECRFKFPQTLGGETRLVDERNPAT